jgi:hypothetical protein
VERRVYIALIALASSISMRGQEVLKPTDPNDGWKLSATTHDVTIYSRVRAGSPIKEFKATGAIDAPSGVVWAVIQDFENYPRFMPYTIESRFVKREADALVGYQRLSPKICADRDYTLRVHSKSWAATEGTTYLNWWTPANELGPPEKPGVVRVKICEGGWLIEPDGPTKTRATYSVYTDTGGLIPPFLANHASQVGISRLFDAVRKQAKNPKYKIAAAESVPSTRTTSSRASGQPPD